MFYRILNISLSILALLMTVVMLFTFRKPRRITGFSSLLSVIISLITPVIFLMISGTEPDLRLVLPFFGFGLLLGYLRGVSMKLEFVGDHVVGRHSRIFLLLWGFSLALNQLLSTLASTTLMAVGLTALFLSTGTQVGFYGIMAARRLGMIPEDLDTGKINNKRFQRRISFAFGGLILVFLLETVIFSIPFLSFLSLPGPSTRASGEELSLSGSELEQDIQIEEDLPVFEPYFNGEQILVWTRPLAAFLSESEHVLYAFNAGGSGVTKVYDQPLSAVDNPAPILSPDGNLWVVTSKRTSETQHYLMSVDGSNTFQLLYQGQPVFIADWSPDFSQILAVSEVSGSLDILTTDREGKDWQIVANQAADEIEPRWSPDGESILFLSNEFGNQDIYLHNRISNNTYNLTRNPAKDQRASWALGGTRIVFTSDRDGIFGLYQMDTEGKNVQLIAQDPICGFEYFLSPDGENLIYGTDPYYDVAPGEPSQDDCQSNTKILLSLQGGNSITLEDITGPKWSPDSSKFLYTSNYDPVNFKSDLLVFHLDGSVTTDITSPTYSVFIYIWSSDSRRVAQVEEYYVEGHGSSQILTVTHADGSNRRELGLVPWDPDIAFAYKGFSWP